MIGQRDGKRVYRMAQVADFVPYNRTYRLDRAFVDVRLPRTGGGRGRVSRQCAGRHGPF